MLLQKLTKCISKMLRPWSLTIWNLLKISMTLRVVSISAFLVFFHSFSYTVVYFLHGIQELCPIHIASYYIIAVQESSTFLNWTSLQLPGPLILKSISNQYSKKGSAEQKHGTENNQNWEKNYQWRLIWVKIEELIFTYFQI